MEAAIKQLRSEGYQISDEDISRFSPTRYRHINPSGKYQFDIETESKRTQLRPLLYSALAKLTGRYHLLNKTSIINKNYDKIIAIY